MKETRYKITTGPDSTHWIPLEPLRLDILDQMQEPAIKENGEVLHSLEVVLAFVDAMISEGRANDWRELHKVPDDNSEAPYSEIIKQ